MVCTAHILREYPWPPFPGYLRHLVHSFKETLGAKYLFLAVKKIKIKFSCLLSLKKWKLNTDFNLSQTRQLNTGFHFLLFISHFFNFAKTMKIKVNPFFPKKNEKWTCSFIFHFQLSEKRDEPVALNNDHLFHSQTLTSFNSIALNSRDMQDSDYAKPMKAFAPMETSKSLSIQVCFLYS